MTALKTATADGHTRGIGTSGTVGINPESGQPRQHA
jgi:hypothetical protein